MSFSVGAGFATAAALVPAGIHCIRRRMSRGAGVLLGLGFLLASTPVHAGPAAPSSPAAPAPPLGRWHAWLEAGRIDLDDDVAHEWGVDREEYFALSWFHRSRRAPGYWGVELGRARRGEATGSLGTIRDFDIVWLDLDEKWAFDLGHGWSADAGLGAALFYVDGEERTIQGGEEIRDPLADIGFGAQIFADANWRAGHLLLGAGVRYQWAFDLIDVDYSNLRFGVHLGLVF